MEQMEDIMNKKRLQHDRIQILNILPAEMWCEVFDRVNDPENKERFMNSSLFFRELFRSQRTQFLFQSVFGVLGRKYEENITIPGSVYRESEPRDAFSDDDDSVDIYWDEISSTDSYWDDDNLGYGYKMETEHIGGLVKGLALRLRSVCKSWDEAVAHYYQHCYLHYLQQYYPPTLKSVEKATKRIIQDEFSDWELDHPDTFLEHFASTHDGGNRNPFFGRSIYFDFPSEEGETGAVYANKLLRVLTKYGHHLWNCTITMQQVSPDGLVAWYSTLSALLELMPNLKVLEIDFESAFSCWCNSKMESSLLKQLEAEMSARPLPTLKDLQVLSATGASGLIPEELIRGYSHVSKLKLEDEEDIALCTFPRRQFKTDFSKLVLPYVTMDWEGMFARMDVMLPDPLNELKLSLPVTVDTVQKIRVYQENQAIQLNFSNLIFWVVAAKSNLCALDFLLSLNNSLIHLEIINVVDDELTTDADNFEKKSAIEDDHILSHAEKGKTIQLSSSADCPLGCNIWSLFPKLIRGFVQQFMETGRAINLLPHQGISQATHFENNENIKISLSTFYKHVCKVKNYPGVSSWVRINIK